MGFWDFCLSNREQNRDRFFLKPTHDSKNHEYIYYGYWLLVYGYWLGIHSHAIRIHSHAVYVLCLCFSIVFFAFSELTELLFL